MNLRGLVVLGAAARRHPPVCQPAPDLVPRGRGQSIFAAASRRCQVGRVRHGRARRGLVVLGAAALSLAACTASTSAPRSPTPSTRTVTGTRTLTRAPAGTSFTPAPATTVAPLPGSGKPKGEKFAHCPYIRAGLNEDRSGGGANIADIEGDRVGRTTVLAGYRPVGCRFYFAYSYGNTRHEAVADILPTTFSTAAAAHNAMVRTAQAGRAGSQQSAPHFAAGADGISYQTKFFGPDGDRDWAFAFAKGTAMVVVHTQQDDSEINARNIAAAIVGKF